MPSVNNAIGLFTAINETEAPEGSLLQADNCVIRTKGIIEPRRGIQVNSYNFGISGDRTSQGFFYQDTLHVHYIDSSIGGNARKIAYDTGSAFTNYTENVYAADVSLLRLKTAAFRNNLYMASLSGIYKISNVGTTPVFAGVLQSLSGFKSYTGNVGSGLLPTWAVQRTGGTTVTVPHTVSLTGGSSAGQQTKNRFFPGEIVFCTSSDANFPGGSKTVNTVLSDLTGKGRFTYTEAGANANSAAAIRYETQVLVDSAGFLNDGNHCAYRFVLDLPDNNQQILLGPPSDKYIVANTSGTTGWVTTESKNVQLKISLPQNLPANARLWVYRTEQVATTIPTSEDFYKIYERALSATDISRGCVLIKDIVFDSLLSDVLYTSPTAETALSANFKPPWAKDIAPWGNRLWFANTKSNYSKSIRIIGELPNNSALEMTIGSAQYTFTAKTSEADVCLTENSFYVPPSGGTVTTRINKAVFNLVEAVNKLMSNFYDLKVYAFYEEDADTGIGFVRLETFSWDNAPQSFSVAFRVPSTVVGSSRLLVDPILPLNTAAGTAISYTTISLSRTSNIVTATFTGPNFHALLPGDTVVISGAGDASFNGTFTITSTTTATITYAQTAANATTTATVTFGGPYTSGAATQESVVNRVYFSKLQQGEAVPLLNYIDIGAPGKQIIRIIPLRERLYVFKEDGIFTIAGEYPFRVDLLDDTARLLAADTCAIVGNQIFCLTTQGIVSVGEAGVAIVSRSWETDLFVLVQKELYDLERTGSYTLPQSWGCGYETDRNYLIQIGSAGNIYVYNYLNKVWTRWTRTQRWAAVHPLRDKLYFGADSANTVNIERKTRADFSADYADTRVTVTSFSGLNTPDSLGRNTKLTVTVSPLPQVGDVIYQSPTGTMDLALALNTYSLANLRIAVITEVSPNTPPTSANITVEYIGGLNLTGTGPPTTYIYQKYPVVLKYNALSGGQPAVVKQFEEWSPIFGARTFRNASVAFGSDAQSNDGTLTTVTAAPLFNDGRTQQGLSTARINPISKRVVVPRTHQRATNLTVTLTIDEACAYWRLFGFNYEANVISNLANRKK